MPIPNHLKSHDLWRIFMYYSMLTCQHKDTDWSASLAYMSCIMAHHIRCMSHKSYNWYPLNTVHFITDLRGIQMPSDRLIFISLKKLFTICQKKQSQDFEVYSKNILINSGIKTDNEASWANFPAIITRVILHHKNNREFGFGDVASNWNPL